MIRNYLKIAVRSLWRNRLYSLINLVGLGVGMAASILVLLWVQNELSFDSYHDKADRTYRVTNTLTEQEEPWVWASSPLKLGATARNEVPGIERIANFKTPWQALVFRVGDELIREKKVAYVDSNWFAAFDYQFVVGNADKALADPSIIILTQTKAHQWFGSPEAALGKIVRIDSVAMVVQAVVRDNPSNSSFRYDVLLPIPASVRNPDDRKNEENWNNFNYQLFLQLNPGVDPEKIGPQLTQLYHTYKKDSSITASLIPLRDIHFDTTFQSDSLPKGNRQTVTTLGFVGLLILIIASINYVNLSTALASRRAKEVGMKKIIGASRGRLFTQFFGESAFIILLALVLALGLISLCLPELNDFTGTVFVLEVGNASLWLLLFLSSGITLLLSGIYPSLLLSSIEPVKVLKGSSMLASTNAGFRQSLVVVQFAISLILIVSTLVIFRQLRYAQNMDSGYQRKHIFSFQVPFTRDVRKAGARDFIKQNLRQTSEVAGVTSTNESIVDLESFHSGSLKWEGKPENFTPTVAQFSVEPETQAVLGLKLAEGRWFQRGIKLDSANVILNETAVRKLGLKKPVVGQWFEFQGARGQIIGVAKDFHFRNLHQLIEPMVLFSSASWQSTIYVKTQPGTTRQAVAKAEKLWGEYFPETPFQYTFLDESFDHLYQSERKAGQLFNVFSGIAILISCLGLFGLATFTAEQRTKEIGVRKVLGASVGSIVALLSRDFLKLVLIAIVIASPIARYAMNAWLADFAYKIDMSWWVFALAGGLAMMVALGTVSFQSVRAALMNPVKSLRSE